MPGKKGERTMRTYQKTQLRKQLGRSRQETQAEALHRATTNVSLTNYPAILLGFAAMGIPMEDILPRENVFTFQAWKALGRYVKKGSHGVRVVSVIVKETKEDSDFETEGEPVAPSYRKLLTGTVVFHISQTEKAN
jgi:hypothetical protein